MSFIIWFTGLSGSGKSTLSCNIANALGGLSVRVELLDGDCLRSHLGNRLGFERNTGS